VHEDRGGSLQARRRCAVHAGLRPGNIRIRRSPWWHDGDGRSLRYFEWTFDPDPSDTTHTVDFVLLLREGNSPVRVEHDHHVNGLFSRGEWLDWLREAGFKSQRMIEDPFGREVFVATL
jgi:hypothetical protein